MILKDLFDLFYEVIKKTRHDKEKRDYYNGGNSDLPPLVVPVLTSLP